MKSCKQPIQMRALWPGVLAFVAGLAMLAAHHLSLLHVMLLRIRDAILLRVLYVISLYSLWRDLESNAIGAVSRCA